MDFGISNEDEPFIPLKSWESIFNTIKAPIMILDDEHRIVRINENMKSKMNILDNPIGKKCYNIVHGTNVPPEFCPHSNTLKNDKEYTEEVELPDFNSWLLVTTSPIQNVEGKTIGSAHIAQDITIQKQNEKKIQNSLELKDLLMRETHHRVKNNLTTISAIMYLQSEHIQNKNLKNILLDAKNRAKTMAVIHQKLYSQKKLEKIDIYYYFDQLLNEIIKTYSINPKIYYTLEVNNIELDEDTALILGLIVNELISNSVKYAFDDGKEGNINVSLHEIDGEFVLKISDDGKTISEDIDIHNNVNFGLTIVNLLVDQIGGQISIERAKGTTFKIIFKL